ncbi:hypothetical protein SARC_09923 [Sphaeroforma arctica JP610]|uniref:Copper transport protein n=1 Tax=Sphaeroforma arctica JP610 TaxID=667725 RepID=A0A0L0FLG1_9EUKA|nr:hypothetical protein SARC_09923 [Sphaeroforma arctica JP610]KNC77617.1 hypothetical protein SARC_09923 [Sphaeroforma arctica JP610]|eukprot:XP_014151519.1 hypothetical protein SARC_09923 [Sphaeroforma arctica JP610]
MRAFQKYARCWLAATIICACIATLVSGEDPTLAIKKPTKGHSPGYDRLRKDVVHTFEVTQNSEYMHDESHHHQHRRSDDTIACPVCNSPVNTNSSYVSVKKGHQKVYVCTLEHAITFAAAPMTYCNGTLPETSSSAITYVEPSVQCMFCGMQGIEEHTLYCNGNQNLHACSMSEHFTRIYSESDLMSSFSGIVEGIETPMELSTNSSNATADSDSSTLTLVSTASNYDKFCYGTGTVMLNGFTFNMDNCITFLFDGLVLDTELKFTAATIGSFILAVVVQVLNRLRSAIEKGQAARQFAENRDPTCSEMALNSSLVLISVTIGYWMMLLTMTYSSWIFMAIVLGLAFGHFLATYMYVKRHRTLGQLIQRNRNRGDKPSDHSNSEDFTSSKTTDRQMCTESHELQKPAHAATTPGSTDKKPVPVDSIDALSCGSEREDAIVQEEAAIPPKRLPDTPCCPY